MKTKTIVTALIAASCIPAFAQAQALNQEIIRMNTSLTNAVNSLLDGYGLNQYKRAVEQPPGVSGSAERHNAALVLRGAAARQGEKLTQTALTQSLQPTAYTLQLLTMCVPGKDYPLALKDNPCATSNFINRGLFVANPNNEAFNMDSLITPYGYTVKSGVTVNGIDVKTDEAQLAERYIAYVANYPDAISNPFAGEDQSTLEKDIRKSDVQKKIMSLRSNTATLSAGLSTLYHLYTERVLVKDLAKDKGIKDDDSLTRTFFPNYPNASLLQLEHYNAAHRASSPDWYTDMGKASPAAVERENLYVNSAELDELFKLRISIERLNAMVSVLQLQQGNVGKQFTKIGQDGRQTLEDATP